MSTGPATAADDGRPVVIASNRGPVSYRREGGDLEAHRGGGGLVSGLAPLLDSGRATWVAMAMSDDDRAAVAAGLPGRDGSPVHLLAPDPDEFRRAYDVVSNETLWFAHHGLFDLVRSPAFDDDWWDSWAAYRRINQSVADAVCEVAPPGAAVLVQDYHLTLVAPSVRRRRDDLRLVHFHHTPFAGPDGLRVLPPAARDELLGGLADHHGVGFHTADWQTNYEWSRDRFLHGTAPAGPTAATFHGTLNSDAAALAATAASPGCVAALAALEERLDGRRALVRVDRMELSKNIVRGFAAFDLLLAARADLRGSVTFVACCYPSRTGVPAYARYRDEVEAEVARVNERWGTAGWTPIELLTDDDYPRSVAALRRADVLVVNPVRDGLNLVAKEGPVVNERDAQLVLSTEAGAWSELLGAADGVNPFDVSATAAALAAALDRPEEERRSRAALLRRAASARTPADWLADQLAAAG